jgi:hypothetical protein
LERRLAVDPDARAAFAELRRLFDDLGHVAQMFPPEGLVAAVMARLPERRSRSGQPFSRSRVISAPTTEQQDLPPGNVAAVRQTSEPVSYLRGENMSEEKRGSFGRSKVWIGLAVAAAGVVIATQYFDFPPGGQSTSGTIVPAQRFRADQPGAADVKLGGPAAAAQPAQAGAAGDPRINDARSQDARSQDARSQDARSQDARSQDARSQDARIN